MRTAVENRKLIYFSLLICLVLLGSFFAARPCFSEGRAGSYLTGRYLLFGFEAARRCYGSSCLGAAKVRQRAPGPGQPTKKTPALSLARRTARPTRSDYASF